MSYSIGEISDLCIKAARGCGKPWGIAEEVGWAARWLARAGQPGADRLAVLFSGKEGVCPVILGTTISDTSSMSLLDRSGVVAEPLVLLPFLSRLVPNGRALQIAIDAQPILLWTDGTDVGPAVPASGQVDVIGDAPAPPAQPPRTRVNDLGPEAYNMLTEMAARTYAPASEASRQRGAGAGLSDND